MNEQQFEALMKVLGDIWIEIRDLRADLHRRDKRSQDVGERVARAARVGARRT